MIMNTFCFLFILVSSPFSLVKSEYMDPSSLYVSGDSPSVSTEQPPKIVIQEKGDFFNNQAFSLLNILTGNLNKNKDTNKNKIESSNEDLKKVQANFRDHVKSGIPWVTKVQKKKIEESKSSTENSQINLLEGQSNQYIAQSFNESNDIIIPDQLLTNSSADINLKDKIKNFNNESHDFNEKKFGAGIDSSLSRAVNKVDSLAANVKLNANIHENIMEKKVTDDEESELDTEFDRLKNKEDSESENAWFKYIAIFISILSLFPIVLLVYCVIKCIKKQCLPQNQNPDPESSKQNLVENPEDPQKANAEEQEEKEENENQSNIQINNLHGVEGTEGIENEEQDDIENKDDQSNIEINNKDDDVEGKEEVKENNTENDDPELEDKEITENTENEVENEDVSENENPENTESEDQNNSKMPQSMPRPQSSLMPQPSCSACSINQNNPSNTSSFKDNFFLVQDGQQQKKSNHISSSPRFPPPLRKINQTKTTYLRYCKTGLNRIPRNS